MGGMTSLLLLLLAGVTVSTLVDLQKRVINGKECDKAERQYHVKLIANDGTDDFLCGGSLISDQWILTAAHCWEDGETLTAHLGVHPGPTSTPIPITTKKTFEDKGVFHDIMLLKLPKRTNFKQVGLHNCRADPTPKHGAKVQIAGLAGTTMDEDGTRLNDEPEKLQCAELKVVTCKRTDYGLCPSKRCLCGSGIFSRPRVDACEGDSGGGVLYNGKISGVISNIGRLACTRSVRFVDICQYMKWINETTGLI